VTDHFCHRYLRARQFDVDKAFSLVKSSIKWLLDKEPWNVNLTRVELETRTGKYYCNGDKDRWGRPIVIFDNGVQNTDDVKCQIDALIFILNYAISLMEAPVEKYFLCINLSNFTMRNNPPWSATKETLAALQEQLPERLGQVVLYQTPWVFQAAYTMVKPLLDSVTVAKIVFLNGDTSEGSSNDLKMHTIVGPNWKDLLNVEKAPVVEGSSVGYDHSKVWPKVIKDYIGRRAANGDPIAKEEEQKALDLAVKVAKGVSEWPEDPAEIVTRKRSTSKKAKKDNEKEKDSSESPRKSDSGSGQEPAKKGWFW